MPRAMAQSSWKDEATISRFLSVVSFCIGAWLAFVSLINVAFGAFAPGQKIEWMGFMDGVKSPRLSWRILPYLLALVILLHLLLQRF